MTDADLATLLRDCLKLWGVDGAFSLARADAELRPVRWFLQTPERAAANRPPRAAPSIVAALSALRNNLGGSRGPAPRIGPAAG